MSDEKLTVRLKTLMCFINDEDKYDDIFIKHKGKKIWPKDKKHEDVSVGNIDLNVIIPDLTPNEDLFLEIWDYDLLSANDLLGKVRMVPDRPGGPYTVDMTPISDKEMARYSIEWEILWPGQNL